VFEVVEVAALSIKVRSKSPVIAEASTDVTARNSDVAFRSRLPAPEAVTVVAVVPSARFVVVFVPVATNAIVSKDPSASASLPTVTVPPVMSVRLIVRVSAVPDAAAVLKTTVVFDAVLVIVIGAIAATLSTVKVAVDPLLVILETPVVFTKSTVPAPIAVNVTFSTPVIVGATVTAFKFAVRLSVPSPRAIESPLFNVWTPSTRPPLTVSLPVVPAMIQ
jgi:hypothetical protein